MTAEEKRLWAIAIGNFIIEFGAIEALVTEVVRKSVAAVHFDVLRRLQFERRASLARASLQELHPAHFQNLVNDFKLLDVIRARRNIIAHSGFVASVYINDDQSEFRFEFGMADAYKRNAVFLQIQHLEQDTLALKDVYARLLPLLP